MKQRGITIYELQAVSHLNELSISVIYFCNVNQKPVPARIDSHCQIMFFWVKFVSYLHVISDDTLIHHKYLKRVYTFTVRPNYALQFTAGNENVPCHY